MKLWSFLHHIRRARAGTRTTAMASNLPKLDDVTRLNGDVIRVLGGNPSKFTLQGTNTYILGRGPHRLLIDTGQGLPIWSDSLASVLQSEKAQIRTCLVTHWHLDHVGGVIDLQALCPNVRIWKGSVNGELSEDLEELKDGMQFEEGGVRIKAVHTPGHTVDHFCLLIERGEDEGALFTGDNVLGHGTAVFEDLPTYLRSLDRMAQTISPSAPAFPGHGEVVPNGGARINEYIRHRQQREEEVLRVLKYGSLEKESAEKGREMTPMEMVKVIYWDVREELHEPAEKGLKLILGKLEGERRVERREGGRWRAVDSGKGAAL